MRDTWFADKRDLVKWGTLAEIAERENLSTIVQVLYFRTGERPPLQMEGNSTEIHPAVWHFFRNVRSVESLGPKLESEIVVIADEFKPNKRSAYRQVVAHRLTELRKPKVVLLDPDTGIAHSNGGASRSKNWREQAKRSWRQPAK
jgi:hypothetical protein